MRILYISKRLNARDGSSVHGREFVKALSSLGHDVIPYPGIDNSNPPARSNRNLGERRKLRVKKLPAKFMKGLKARNRYIRDIINLWVGFFESRSQVKEIYTLLKDVEPELIVYRAMLYDFIPNILRKNSNAPIIAEVNSIKSIEMDMGAKINSTWLSLWAEEYSLKPADAITVVSAPIKKYLESTPLTKPVVVVENGVNLENFQPDADTKQTLKNKYGINGKITIGYIGSYKRWHGLADTLKVAHKLINDGLPVHFVLIGSGEDELNIQRLIDKLALESHVTRIPNLPHEQIAKHVNLIDVALMTYPAMEFFYFSPLKMYEYLAAGIPIVSSRLGQIETTLENLSFGSLVTPGDVNGFAEAIKPLVLDTHHRHLVSEEARQWAVDNCSWTKNASTVLSVQAELR